MKTWYFLNENYDIYIYGAGVVGKRCACLMQESLVPVKGFLVTDKSGNADEIDGIPVYGLDEFSVSETSRIIIAVTAEKIPAIQMTLEQHGIRQYTAMDDKFFFALRKAYFLRCVNSGESIYMEDDNFKVELGYLPLAVKKEKENKRFRILLDENIYSLSPDFGKSNNILDLFEKNYGEYCKVSECSLQKDTDRSVVKVLKACCHLDKKTSVFANESYIVPIQVGKTLTDHKICDLSDDAGIHISDRNYNYCECTALYWAWKNNWQTDADYIGLCHYRRKFNLSEEQAFDLQNRGIDIVLTVPTYLVDIKEHFGLCTKQEGDWEVLRQAVEHVGDRYAKAFEQFEHQNFVCQCNMSIMRRDIFDQYAEFLFGVLGYVEEYYLPKMDRRDRYLGYLAEPLLSVFVLAHKEEYCKAYVEMLVDV